MIAFIDDHRGSYGVEPICKVLPIAPSIYHAHVAQRVDAGKRSARARRVLSKFAVINIGKDRQAVHQPRHVPTD